MMEGMGWGGDGGLGQIPHPHGQVCIQVQAAHKILRQETAPGAVAHIVWYGISIKSRGCFTAAPYCCKV